MSRDARRRDAGRRSGSPRIPAASSARRSCQHAEADPRRLGVRAGDAAARRRGRPRRRPGPGRPAARALRRSASAGRGARSAASGSGTSSPGLGQYWHPHMLDARVDRRGASSASGAIALDGARAYAEKNWTPYRARLPVGVVVGAGARVRGEDVCVAFAGGRLLGVRRRRGRRAARRRARPRRRPARGRSRMRAGRRDLARCGADAARRRHRRGRRGRRAVPAPGAGPARAPRRAGRVARCTSPGALHVASGAAARTRFEGTSRARRARAG